MQNHIFLMKKKLKSFINWLDKIGFLSYFWRFSGNGIKYIIDHLNGSITFYNTDERAKVMVLIQRIKSENKMLLENNEAYQLYMAVKNTHKIDGCIAEVGSYLGGSAKLICEAKGEKELHLFDTFEGLPPLTEWDNSNQFKEGYFKSSFDFVKKYLNNYSNVYLYKGIFPKTSKPIEEKQFSFVHLDVDLHEATLASIEFFYPRMVKGGVLISHDYDETGVSKAFNDYFFDKPESIIEISGCQCLVVKL